MGTPTKNATANGPRLDVVKIEPDTYASVKQELEYDGTFYDEAYDEDSISVDLNTPSCKEESMDDEFSELEYDDDECDTESMTSAFSNDHNYNMSPASRISSPETCHTSDPGYESQNSPRSTLDIDEMPIINLDEFGLWNDISDPITELFPSLV